jgi:hypothetical protein
MMSLADRGTLGAQRMVLIAQQVTFIAHMMQIVAQIDVYYQKMKLVTQ